MILQKPLRVLLLEENQSDADSILTALGQAGFVPLCRRVDSAQSFLAMSSCECDLVIADLPGSDFHRLGSLSDLRARLAGVPLVVITGDTEGQRMSQFLQDGAVSCIGKSHLEDLGAAVASAVESAPKSSKLKTSELLSLRQESKFLRAVLDGLREVIFQIDADARWTFLNTAWFDITGFSLEGSLGKPVVRFLVEEDCETFEKAFAEMAACREESLCLELRMTARTGDTHWVEMRARTLGGGAGDFEGATGTLIDITERRVAELARTRNDRYYQSLLDNALDLITVFDSYGTVMYNSPSVRNMLGYEVDELVGGQIYHLVHPDDLDRVRGMFEKTARQPEHSHEAIFKFLHKDGSWRIMEAHGRSTVDAAGRVVVVVNSRDITDRTHALAEASSKSAQLDTLFEVLPGMVWLKDTRNRIVQLNDAAARSMGLTAEQVRGKSTRYIHPADADEFYQHDLEVIRSGKPKLGIVEVLHDREGRKSWIRTDKVPIKDASGQVTGILVLSQNVTDVHESQEALRRSENLFRTLTSHVPVGIYLSDPNGDCLYVNDAWCAITGMKAADAMGKGWMKALHPEDVQRIWDEWAATVSERRDFELMDYRFCTPDREVRWVDGRAIMLRGEDGSHIGFLGTVVDVTERRQHAAERQRLATRLLEVQEEERKQISTFLHDNVGQTLTLLKLGLEESSGGDRQAVRRISDAVRRIDELLKAIREKASEQRPPLIDDLEIDAALEYLVEEFNKEGPPFAALEVEHGIPSLDPVRKTCIYRTLQESLKNVRKHARASKVRIAFGSNEEHVWMDTRDNGCGFDVTSPQPGSGAGLIGLREMLRPAGGALVLESKPGFGTCVRIMLPLEPSHHTAKDAP